jgi:hypothetical protein
MRPLRLAALTVLLAASSGRADVREPLPGCEGFEAELARKPELHECLRLDQIQVIGTHNSYHLQPLEPYRTILFALLGNFDPLGSIAWDYAHLPLDEQFASQGIRQIELDVFADPLGGLYANRLGPVIAGTAAPPGASGVPALDEPGMKVLHVQDLDFETTCYTLRACLETIVEWSDANPTHLPIFVLVELKDDRIQPDFGFVVPVPFDAEQMDALDAEILAAVPRDKLVLPDDVRGPRATLDDAIRLDGWPAIGRLRGKLIFAMDNGGAKRAIYTAGRPSAEGRVLFPNAVEGAPDAAFIKLNDPLGDFARIQAAVADGYLVRTRADSDTVEARINDTGPRDAALASGAQFVSTDYPVPDPRFGTGYAVSFPDRTVARCNPVTGVEGCSAPALDGFVPVPEPARAASAVVAVAALGAAARRCRAAVERRA